MIAALAVLAAGANAERRDAGAAEDLALVERHRAGDPAAFASIYRAHAADVHRRLSRLLGPVPEREDLLQDVFLALHRALPAFRGEAALATLLQRIAINKACELLRARYRRPTTSVDSAYFDDIVSRAGSPEAQASAREELAAVFACLARIKPKKRVALLLRVVEGLSFEQIGELVDATPETVAKRVQYGHRELEALLARRGGVA
ncbi:MAG TPA: RNA polymerase sigma factor [Kofleriaceae bacterium]